MIRRGQYLSAIKREEKVMGFPSISTPQYHKVDLNNPFLRVELTRGKICTTDALTSHS